MVTELHSMLERPDYTTVSRETEGEESTMFRLDFLFLVAVFFKLYVSKCGGFRQYSAILNMPKRSSVLFFVVRLQVQISRLG